MSSLPVVVERKSPVHRAFQLAAVVAVIGFFLFVTNFVENFSASRWAVALTLAVAILGLNIVTGYSGQISIGHSAFFGIGAYTTMILIADHGWPFLATLPVAGAVGFARGAGVGGAALRLCGLFFFFVTPRPAFGVPAILKLGHFFWFSFPRI